MWSTPAAAAVGAMSPKQVGVVLAAAGGVSIHPKFALVLAEAVGAVGASSSSLVSAVAAAGVVFSSSILPSVPLACTLPSSHPKYTHSGTSVLSSLLVWVRREG